MPRYTATNNATGETVSFDWQAPNPPTERDVARISDQQRQSRTQARESILKNEPGFWDQVLMSDPVHRFEDVMSGLGLSQEWHPISSAKEVGPGLQKVFTGQGQEEHPRVAGAMQAFKGAMGVAGPPLTAIGYATAPEVMAPAMMMARGAGEIAQALTPSGLAPETKEAISTGASLLGGAAGGIAGARAVRPGPVEPPPTDITVIPRGRPSPGPPRPPGVVTPSQLPAATRQARIGPVSRPALPPGRSFQMPPIGTYKEPTGIPETPSPISSTVAPKPSEVSSTAGSSVQSVASATVRSPSETALRIDPSTRPGPTDDLVSGQQKPPTTPSEVATPVPSGTAGVGQPIVPTIRRGPGIQPPGVQPPGPVAPPVSPQTLPQAPTGATPKPSTPGPVPGAQVQPRQLSPPPPVPGAPPPVQPPPEAAAPKPIVPSLPGGQGVAPRAPAAPQAMPPRVLPPKPPPPIVRAPVAEAPRVPVKLPSTTDLMVQRIMERRAAEAPEVPKPETPEVPPPVKAPGEPEVPASQELTPYRQQRIDELKGQIKDSEAEGGDDFVAKMLGDHLKEEETYAEMEKRGSPDVKRTLGGLDQVYQRIHELENKEVTGPLSDAEQQELGTLYGNANKLSNVLMHLWKDETGSAFPEGRGFFDRYRFRKDLEDPGRSKSWWEYLDPRQLDPRNIMRERPDDQMVGVSAFGAKLRSANQVLRETKNIPAARKIGLKTPLVEDLKHKFVGTYERRAADIIRGLSRRKRIEVGKILDQYEDPAQARASSPEVMRAAMDIRDLLDEIHAMFPGGIVRGKNVGYTRGYLMHMARELNADSDFMGTLKDLYDYHVGPFRATARLFRRERPTGTTATEQPFGQFGVGDPSSSIIEERTGQLKDIEYDVRRVLPVYIEGAGKVIYDKPWVNQARQLLNQIPDSAKMTKELATAYLRNYARYDAYPGLQHAWNSFTRPLMNMVGRSLLGLNTRLFTLHASRLFANIWPELPTKYLTYGIKEVSKAPIDSFQEAGRVGLLPQNIRPWEFKRPMEKIDSVTNLMGFSDFVPDGVAFHGFKKMYMDQGYSPTEAARMAVDKTKDVSLRVTPARAAKFYSDDLGPLKPFTQFKQQVGKIAEQYATRPLNAIQRGDYKMLARYLVGVGSMMYVHEKLGIATWHLNPYLLPTYHAAAYDRLGTILKEASKGNIKKALQDAAILAIPAGESVKRQLKKGLSMFEEVTQ